MMMRFGDGPRRRRMIRGTIARIGELAMRYGHPSQLATLDCTSSRRSTVMCALPRATAVTTVYQRDSSSKRPRASVVSAARAPTRPRYHVADTASRASRPAGGAFGAPGHRARHVVGGSYASKLTLAGNRQATIERSGLDRGSFHIRLVGSRRHDAKSTTDGAERRYDPGRASVYARHLGVPVGSTMNVDPWDARTRWRSPPPRSTCSPIVARC